MGDWNHYVLKYPEVFQQTNFTALCYTLKYWIGIRSSWFEKKKTVETVHVSYIWVILYEY